MTRTALIGYNSFFSTEQQFNTRVHDGGHSPFSPKKTAPISFTSHLVEYEDE